MEKRDTGPAVTGPVVIGGRRFTPLTDGTLEHDLHVLALYSKAGVAEMELRPGEEPDGFASRIAKDLMGSGAVLEILGSLLIPEEVDPEKWTPKDAEDVARFLGSLKSAEDKAKVKAMVLDLVIDFFERGMISFFRSQRSSPGDHPDQDSSESGAQLATAGASATGGR